MNVLFVEESLDPSLGGIERVTYCLSKYLTKRGIGCYFIYYQNDYPKIEKQYKLKVDLKRQGCKEFKIEVLSFVEKNEIDVVINQDQYHWRLEMIYRELINIGSCKIINCFHLSPDYFKYNKLTIKGKLKNVVYKLFTGYTPDVYVRKKNYELCDRFVLLSQNFMNDFINLYGVTDTHKLISISNPLSFDESLDINVISQKKKQVLIISRLQESHKNICSALRIWKRIEDYQIFDWKLVLAGYGRDEKLILDYMSQLELKNVCYVGRSKNPQKLYQESKIFMMTSNFEGFGMTLTEALQNACVPFVFNTFSSLHDIIESDYNGFIIPAKDEILYATKMIEFMQGKNQDKYAVQALESSRKFSIENIGLQWIHLLNELVVYK